VSDPERRGDPDPAQWSDPTPTYDMVAADYATRFVDELAYKPFDRELLIRFAESVRPRSTPDLPVCDLGCGPGHIGAFVASQGVEVIGFDLSPGMVDQARHSFPHLRFARGDMTALDGPAGGLAGIVCFYALIHLPRAVVPAALEEMHRRIADGGDLLLAVHGGEGSLHATVMLDHSVSLDATLFTLAELTGLVEGAGFEVREAHERPPAEQEVATQRLYVWATRRS
jgi:SAM-dependent methyltransferase